MTAGQPAGESTGRTPGGSPGGDAAGPTLEEALAAARARAAAARAAGGYADLGGFQIAPKDRVGTDQLMEWAVLEPDESTMRSTRRLGVPITYFKRALLHVLRQYHGELTAEQTRFNMHLLVHVAELEDRIARLEAERER